MILDKLDSQSRLRLGIWCAINVCFPLLPIFIKVLINVSSPNRVIIIDNIELLYYNLIICMLHINLIKKITSCIELIYTAFVVVIGIGDIVLLVIKYFNLATDFINGYSVFFAILIPIAATVYKRTLLIAEKEGV